MLGLKYIAVAGILASLFGNSRPARADEPGPVLIKASTLVGTPVENLAGEKLAKVEEVVIDVNTGQIRYMAMSFSKYLARNNVAVSAVPWKAFVARRDKESGRLTFVLDLPRETLLKAPGFVKEKWPNFADPEWGKQIDEFYGLQRPLGVSSPE